MEALSHSLQSEQEILYIASLKEKAHKSLEDYKQHVESGVISAYEISEGAKAGHLSSKYLSTLEEKLELCHNFLRIKLEESGQGNYSELDTSVKEEIINKYLQIEQEILGHTLSIEYPRIFNTYNLIKKNIDELVEVSSSSRHIRVIVDIVTIQKELADFIDGYRNFSGNIIEKMNFLNKNLREIENKYKEKFGYLHTLDVPSGSTKTTQESFSPSSSLYSSVSSLTVDSQNNRKKPQ